MTPCHRTARARSVDHLKATCVGWTQGGRRALLSVQDRCGKVPRYLSLDLAAGADEDIHIELDRPRACGLGLVELVQWTSLGLHIRLAPEAEQLGWARNLWVHPPKDDAVGETQLRNAAWFFEGVISRRALGAESGWPHAA